MTASADGDPRAASATPEAVARGVVHAASFEESDEPTLERIARERAPDDRVLLFGPAPFAEAFARLARDGVVPVTDPRGVLRVGRAAGAWRMPVAASDFCAGREVVVHGRRAEVLVRWCLPANGASGCVPPAAIRPALPPRTLPPAPAWPEARRPRIRRELGLARDEFAILLGGEPPEWCDPSFVVRAVAMASVAGARLRLVVSPRVARLGIATLFLVDGAGARAPIVDARADRPWELLPALDAFVLDRDGLVDAPVECRGWRSRRLPGVPRDLDAGGLVGEPVSPLPALWAIATGVPAFVHRSVDLGVHAEASAVGAPLHRFDRDVAAFADALIATAKAGGEVARDARQDARAANASAASR